MIKAGWKEYKDSKPHLSIVFDGHMFWIAAYRFASAMQLLSEPGGKAKLLDYAKKLRTGPKADQDQYSHLGGQGHMASLGSHSHERLIENPAWPSNEPINRCTIEPRTHNMGRQPCHEYLRQTLENKDVVISPVCDKCNCHSLCLRAWVNVTKKQVMKPSRSATTERYRSNQNPFIAEDPPFEY